MIRWLASHPLFAVLTVFTISIAALLVVIDPLTLRPRVGIDASVDNLLPASSADREVYDRVRQLFGDTEAVLVAVTLDPVFTPENLKKVTLLTEQFRELPGAERVFSLATAPNLLTAGSDIDVRTFTQQVAEEPHRLEEFRKQVDANPVYRGSLVSKDGRTAAFAISLSGLDEQQFRDSRYPERIREAVAKVAGDVPVWITGSPIIKSATTSALLQTLTFTIPLIFGLMAVILMIAFRSLRSMLVCVLTVAMSLLWTVATVILFGLTLNLVTAIVPPLVLTLGLTYAIHVLSDFLKHEPPSAAERALKGAAEVTRQLPAVSNALGGLSKMFRRERSNADRAAETMTAIAVPIGLSVVTTVIGFLGFLPNPLPAIRQFGALAMVGIGYSALLALVFIPAALTLVGSSQRRELPGEKMFKRMAESLATFDLRHRIPIILVGLSLIPLGVWLATDIKAGSETIRDYGVDHPVRAEYEAINGAFNGANALAILIETHVNDALTDPELAREVENLQVWLRAQPEVGSAISYLDFLKLTNQSLNENDSTSFVIPYSQAEIKQLLVFGGNEELQRFIDARLRSTQITLRINVDGTARVGDLVERIEQRLSELPKPLNGKVTGSEVLALHTVGEIVGGQGLSIAIAIGGIWLLLSMLFTSIRAGFIALLPTVIPVAVYFGTLGLLDIPLSPTTSLIACIVLGVTVDETFHFLAKFNADARDQANEMAAAKSALAGVLRPITLNMFALCLGFLSFTGGGLESQVLFGLLAAFTLFVAWGMDITLTPALGSYMRIVTLWDLLRLDLGKSPQHTIPLMAGLSLRQARIFALLSRMEKYQAHQRVIKEGDWARDMYVIVDGELQAWVDRDGERRTLSSMGRGAVLGEAGFFGQRRTANVDAMSEARLLRFGSEELERLRVRYPRIAATVFRNLNRIQAERLARTTAMLQ
ncbi:MAG TPA: MMPL family transporter [Verrucomicrobiae bacterium]|nr:MMPL family transporter [Verrucomicrobiae bacterium]